MGKQEDFAGVIQQLRENLPDVTGVMIASADGLSIGTDFTEDEAARIAAMGASAVGLGSRITKSADLGDMHDLVIEGSSETLIIYMIGSAAILALRAPRRANLGLIRLEGPKAVDKIEALVSN
ncbi:MAG: roadblock/LC7 domain-containing protein [Candidatus Thiodiazotropha sp.]